MRFRVYVKTGEEKTFARRAVDYESDVAPSVGAELALPDGTRAFVTHLLNGDPPDGYHAHYAADELRSPHDVIFDVYTSVPFGLSRDDASALAEILSGRGNREKDLAGRVRQALGQETLVEVAPDDRQALVDALEELQPRATRPGDVVDLALNLRMRISGGDLPPPVA